MVAAQRHWRVLSTHAHILVLLHLQPRITMREVAVAVGITERRVAANIADLRAEGLMKVIKRGPPNTYRVLRSATLPSSAHGPKTVGEYLDTVMPLVQKTGSMAGIATRAGPRPHEGILALERAKEQRGPAGNELN